MVRRFRSASVGSLVLRALDITVVALIFTVLS
jgi:hypothetical protein